MRRPSTGFSVIVVITSLHAAPNTDLRLTRVVAFGWDRLVIHARVTLMRFERAVHARRAQRDSSGACAGGAATTSSDGAVRRISQRRGIT
jgi:hypothetical protein